MSREDVENDDSFDWSSQPTKAKPKPEIERFIKDGKLTDKGTDSVKWFRHLELVPDAGCLLDFSVVYKVFQTWRSDGQHEAHGFSFDTLEEEDDFERTVVAGWPADGPLQT